MTMTCGILRYEAALLRAIASELPNDAKAVNIGAGAGVSSLAILDGAASLPDFRLWSIDIEECEDELETLAKYGRNVAERFTQVVGNSNDIGLDWEYAPLDLIFIDGAHGYDEVTRDLELWAPLVRDGGFVVCHDYGDPRQVKCTQAIDDWMNNDYFVLARSVYLVVFLRKHGDIDWSMGRIEDL